MIIPEVAGSKIRCVKGKGRQYSVAHAAYLYIIQRPCYANLFQIRNLYIRNLYIRNLYINCKMSNSILTLLHHCCIRKVGHVGLKVQIQCTLKHRAQHKTNKQTNKNTDKEHCHYSSHAQVMSSVLAGTPSMLTRTHNMQFHSGGCSNSCSCGTGSWVAKQQVLGLQVQTPPTSFWPTSISPWEQIKLQET